MPVIEAHILEGYARDEKSRLSAALTDAVRSVIPASGDAITVLLHEYPEDSYARGGRHRIPAPARPDPKAIVLRYLAAMEARDLDAASALLGVAFEMRFPGKEPMSRLSELVAWAKDRYRFVRKTNEAVEAFQSGNTAVVFVRGTLSGEWPDGRPFEGIRFIDRFELEHGMIARQDVWNDLGEIRNR